ncbi:hypothetical protein P3W45_001861, partial [Vairimorpha bombi]
NKRSYLQNNAADYFLQEHKYEIEYIRRKENDVADAIFSKERKSHKDYVHGSIEATYVLALREGRWTIYVYGYHQLCKELVEIRNPFDKVGIDVVGPLPRANNGNIFVVLGTDHTTRWSVARALKFKTAWNIARFIIEEIFVQYGPSKKLLSDQGCEFIVSQICVIMDTKKVLLQLITPNVMGQPNDEWDEFLPLAPKQRYHHFGFCMGEFQML